MPPVAGFGEALESLLNENREAGRGIQTWRQLNKRLHELDPDKQSADSWKRSTNRYRGSNAPEPEEETIALYAAALEKPVSRFPPAVPRAGRSARLEARLAELEGLVDSQGKESERVLRSLRAQVRALERRLDAVDQSATEAQVDA